MTTGQRRGDGEGRWFEILCSTRSVICILFPLFKMFVTVRANWATPCLFSNAKTPVHAFKDVELTRGIFILLADPTLL